MADDFVHLEDRAVGDWHGFEKRFSQDLSDFNGIFTQSGYAELDDDASYLFAWRENVVSATGAGLIRLSIYDSGYNSISGYESIDLPISEQQTSGWVRNIVRLRHYKDANISANDYLLPSGATFIQVQVLVPKDAPSGVELYVNGLDLVRGNSYYIYTSSSGNVTAVEYSGLNNGYANIGNPVLRDSYEFIGSRAWTATDITIGPNSYLTFEDTDAVNNTEYSYVIDAYDLNGNKSPLSTKQTIMAGDIYAPSHVSGLIIAAGPETANFVWTCPADSDYSHANIYSDVTLTTLVRSELGVPGQQDSSLVGGLTAGVSYDFWVTTVDKYGNENRISPPSGTVVPNSFSETSPLEIVFDGDDYVKQEVQTLKVISRVEMSGLPVLLAYDANNIALTASTLTALSSYENYYVWSGNITIGAGAIDGQGRALASGLTATGTIAQSENKLFIIDKVAPSLSVSLTGYNYLTAGKYFYNAVTQPKYNLTVTDSGGISSYAHRVGGSPSSPYVFNTFVSGGNNSAEFALNTEGLHSLAVKAIDYAGNLTEVTQNVYLDTKYPIVSISGVAGSSQFLPWYNSSTMQVKFLARDNEDAGAAYVAGISGVNWRYSYDHAPTTEAWNFATGQDPTVTVPTAGTIPTSTASVYIQYYGIDNAGNTSNYITDIINIDAKPPYFAAGLWGNCHPVPGGFHLLWNIASILDDAPSSGFKLITLYRADNVGLTGAVQIATIPYDTTVRSFVDTSSDMEYYRTYWWYMKVTDNAGNVSSGSPVITGIIDHNIKGIFRNLIGNGSFERTEAYDTNQPLGWTKYGSPTIQTGSGHHGIKYAAVTRDNYYYISNFPLINAKVNKRQVLSFRAKRLNSSSSAGASVTMKFYDANKSLISTSGTQTVTWAAASVPYTSWGQFDIPIGNSAGAGGINPPNNGSSVTALSCDIFFSGTHITDNLFLDSIQLEDATSNTQTVGTEYVDSYNITGDILQGQRIIGSQIEANTITAEHITVGIHGGNFLQNSSFENTDYTGTRPAYFGFAGSTAISTSSPYSGSKCIKLTSINDIIYMHGYQSTGTTLQNLLPVSGNNYCFSFYARSDGGTSNITLNVNWKNSSFSDISVSSYNFTVSSTDWGRKSVTIGSTGTIIPPVGAIGCVVLVYISSAGAGCFLDCLQYELGTIPTIYNGGGVTEIDGGTIKTGRIQSFDDRTYFDLDSSTINTQNSTGDYTRIDAGQIRTYDVASTKRTEIVSGTVTNINVTTGDYSRLTEGSLQFYNAIAGITTNYGNQIIYLDPNEIICGTQYNFAHQYSQQAPFVIPIANRVQVYSAANSATNQYIGFSMQPVTITGFMPRAFLYAGGLPGSTVVLQSTPIVDYTMALGGSNNNTYESTYDAVDYGHGGSSITAVNVTLRTRNTNATNNIIYNRFTVRVRAAATWDGSAPEQSTNVEINTYKLSSDWVYSTIQFVGLTSTAKSIKADWYYKSNSDASESQIYKIEYINAPSVVELTGSGIIGAIVIGRTI